jgi:diamine N-acetyltransferase
MSAIAATFAMRRASPNDVQELVSMMAEFYAESAYTLNQQRATDAFAGLLADDRLGYVWFIQAGSRDVGYVVVTLSYSMEYGGASACVDDLYVRPAFRGAGLGAAALGEVRAFCAARGVRAIRLETGKENAAARAVYRRAGFVDTDRLHLTLELANPTHVG